MGSKKKTAPQGVQPKLRFPEFRGACDWEVKPLNKVCDVNPSNTDLPESFIYIDLESVSGGKLLAKKRVRKDAAPSRAQRLLQSGDVIFQIVRPYQRNNLFYNFIDKEHYVASTGYAQLRALYSSSFLYHSVHTDNFVDRVMAKCTGSSYPAINSTDLAKLALAIPEKEEQQKIADCLSSLDELIEAEDQKLEALQKHKKGLMQELFPAEGETLPKRRFPEFKGAWEIPTLGEISHRIVDKVGTQALETVSISAGIGFVSQAKKFSRDISGEQYKNYTVLNEGDFSYNKGNSKKFPQGCVYKLREFKRVAAPNVFISFKFKKGYLPDFYQGYFESNFHGKQLKRFITSGARSNGLLNISAKEFFSINLPTPLNREEQRKIAECLSSVDDIITAQSQKLNALREHKKGLMQQLFPAVSEVQE